ncbi:hypothetical protein FH972_024310 [Carpinus fangiana]|uniref:Uncharacterized protein n=1 Tax=Carpinus fangiana TaxID=176857 RepID=A0A5N6KY29_9ROSI|nr:hypothetical protein FH972_024310 [Carpinus fangiana]
MGWYQTAIPPTAPQTDLSGQTIVITGANTGLGFEAALQLLRLRASNLVLGVRSIRRGEDARLRLLADAEVRSVNPAAVIKVLQLDLIDYDSVVNYLSNALLTLLLLPHLSSTPATPIHKPTITWVGSMAQGFNSLAKLPEIPPSILARFSDPRKYSALTQYPNSKMFVAMFVRALGQHLPDSNVVVNNLCPGTVDTAADDKLPFYLRIPMNLNRRLRARTVEEGARTLVFASSVAGGETHGKYIANNEISQLAAYADTANGRLFSEQLWRETLQECASVDNRVKTLKWRD